MSAASEALLAVAAHVEADTRGPKAAVATLWIRLHGEIYDRDGHAELRVAFEALAEECGISASSMQTYLGPQLKRMTAAERGAALRAASAKVPA